MRRAVEMRRNTDNVIYCSLCQPQVPGTVLSEGVVGIMRVRMVAYHVSLIHDAPGYFRIELDILADDKEGRLDIMTGEHIKDF